MDVFEAPRAPLRERDWQSRCDESNWGGMGGYTHQAPSGTRRSLDASLFNASAFGAAQLEIAPRESRKSTPEQHR